MTPFRIPAFQIAQQPQQCGIVHRGSVAFGRPVFIKGNHPVPIVGDLHQLPDEPDIALFEGISVSGGAFTLCQTEQHHAPYRIQPVRRRLVGGKQLIQIRFRQHGSKLFPRCRFRQHQQNPVDLCQRNPQIPHIHIPQVFQYAAVLRTKTADQFKSGTVTADPVVELIFGIGRLAGFDAGIADHHGITFRKGDRIFHAEVKEPDFYHIAAAAHFDSRVVGTAAPGPYEPFTFPAQGDKLCREGVQPADSY